MNQEKIGKFIQEQRKKKLTQEDLAEKLNVNVKSISRWENGKCMPDLSLLNEICNILNITLDDFINGEIVTLEKQYTIMDFIKIINFRYKKKIKKIILGLILMLVLVNYSIAFYYNHRFIYKYETNIIKISELDEKIIMESIKNMRFDYVLKKIDNQNILFINNGYTLSEKVEEMDYEIYPGEYTVINKIQNIDHLKIYYVEKNISKISKMDKKSLKDLIKESKLLFER